MEFFGPIELHYSFPRGDTCPIGHFGKYHNTLCLSPQILHKHCFQFLLGIRIILRENKNNAYAKFGGTNKEHYSIFRSGLYSDIMRFTVLHNRHHKVSRSVPFFMQHKTVTILLTIRVRGHFVISITKNHESHYVTVLDNPPKKWT